MTDDPKKQQGAEPQDDRGLCCRRCGCRHFYVIYTKRTTRNRILRRRECRHCGQRITTYETESQAQNTSRSGPPS